MVEEAGVYPMLHRLFRRTHCGRGYDHWHRYGVKEAGREGNTRKDGLSMLQATLMSCLTRRRSRFKTPKEKMMKRLPSCFTWLGMVLTKQKFMDGVRADPQTYKDWGGGGKEWNIETSGKEGHTCFPPS